MAPRLRSAGPVEVTFLPGGGVVFVGRTVSAVCVLLDACQLAGVSSERHGERVLVADARCAAIDVAFDLGLWLVPQRQGVPDGLLAS